MSDAGVVGAEASGGHGAEGMAQGVERPEPFDQQQGGQQPVEPGVDEEQHPGGVLHPSLGRMMAGSGHFGLHEGLSGGTLSEDRHEQHDDPQAAEEVGAGTPEENAARHQGRRLQGAIGIFHVRQHGGPGGAEAGLGLEHGVDDAHSVFGGSMGAAEHVG